MQEISKKAKSDFINTDLTNKKNTFKTSWKMAEPFGYILNYAIIFNFGLIFSVKNWLADSLA